jgi:hypothetical protein
MPETIPASTDNGKLEARDTASYITGVALSVTGGQEMN